MSLHRRENRVLIFRDFIFIIIAIGVIADLVFLHFFLFNSAEKKGVRMLKNKQPIEATDYFLKSLDLNQASQFLYLNLALSYDLQNRPLKAMEQYDKTLQSDYLPSRFFAYFNKAELSARLNRLDEALNNYQSALTFETEVKKIKQNIELLFKKNKKGGSQKNKDKDQKQDSKQDQNKKQENSEENKDQAEPSPKQKTPQPRELTPEQRKAILEEIEKQESKVRAKQFKSKKRYTPLKEKDW